MGVMAMVSVELSYYYGYESEQFSFYRIPKLLFTDSRFANLSTDAKLLYGILLDRMSLSMKNGWHDEHGRVYIIFTLEDVTETLGYRTEKATPSVPTPPPAPPLSSGTAGWIAG